MASAVLNPRDEMPKHKIELPKPGDDKQYGGTRTVHEGYQLNVANQIGEGTYGQVFTGVCKDTKAKVALKKIRMDTEKEGFPITAIREIKILSSMKHENVVNLREIVRSDIHKNNNFKGSIYMVFDYAEHDLTGLMAINKYKFTEAQVKCIMKQLLKGLAYVHGNGVLHRDLKASNILIDRNGIVKLADFGLARTYQERNDALLTNRVITLWYRPPELLLGADKYGPEVDMWSVGCILAELLVGKPLFPGKDELDQLDRIFAIMGTPTKESWPEGDKLRGWGSFPRDRYKGVRLRQWVNDTAARQGQAPIKDTAVQLMEKLLQIDPAKRLDALSAFRDPWFWNDDPPACEPKDLPCSGSAHEFTMKKKRMERSDAQHAVSGTGIPVGGFGGGPQGGGGGGQQHEAKRARYLPPAGGVSSGYGGGSVGGPPRGGGGPPPQQQPAQAGFPGRPGPGSMPPPQRGSYGYGQPQRPPGGMMPPPHHSGVGGPQGGTGGRPGPPPGGQPFRPPPPHGQGQQYQRR